MDQKISTWIGFLMIALVILPTAWVCYNRWLEIEEAYSVKIQTATSKESDQNSVITSAEKKRIDVWISENNLNQYGDPKETVYAGGTPLFNEATGEQLDKYQYIIKKHPERPWNDS